MPNPTIRVHDIETGETVDRPMTKEEFADYQAGLNALSEDKAAQEQNKTLKESAYEKLGLTAEEITALLG